MDKPRAGGPTLTVDTPIDMIPIFVKAGTPEALSAVFLSKADEPYTDHFENELDRMAAAVDPQLRSSGRHWEVAWSTGGQDRPGRRTASPSPRPDEADIRQPTLVTRACERLVSFPRRRLRSSRRPA